MLNIASEMLCVERNKLLYGYEERKREKEILKHRQFIFIAQPNKNREKEQQWSGDTAIYNMCNERSMLMRKKPFIEIKCDKMFTRSYSKKNQFCGSSTHSVKISITNLF